MKATCLSCAGSTAAIDVGLYLVTRHCGRGKANQAVRHMMLQGMRPASLPQAHFYADLAAIADARVHQAVHFMEQRLDDPPSIDAIARYVGCSPRQLERAFAATLSASPAAFQRRLRLDYACWLLENSPRSITQIAFDCGFSDAAHFSREFRHMFDASPREFRTARAAMRHGPSRSDNHHPVRQLIGVAGPRRHMGGEDAAGFRHAVAQPLGQALLARAGQHHGAHRAPRLVADAGMDALIRHHFDQPLRQRHHDEDAGALARLVHAMGEEMVDRGAARRRAP